MSLYSKYRPKSFAGMMGNFTAIEELLKRPDHNHALLFTGHPGTGKTSASRIVASLVGAEDTDIREVNIGDKTGIDDMRAIINDVSISPWGRAKVYILDEFHKATEQAQTAMFKALEDIPNHVYFILCSSEPKKIKEAIRTRVTTFDFSPLTVDMLYGILCRVKKAESIEVQKDILFDIAEGVGGSARMALTVLEAIASLSPENQRKEVSKQVAGIDDAQVIDLCRLIFGKGVMWKEIASYLLSLKDQGVEAESVRRAIIGYGQAILLKNATDTVAFTMEKLVDNVYDSGFPGLTLKCYLAWIGATRGF
jgi:DNA polymerase-3 subunit gamma/tau